MHILQQMSRLDFLAVCEQAASISAKGNDDPATGIAAAKDRSGVASCLGVCKWCEIRPRQGVLFGCCLECDHGYQPDCKACNPILDGFEQLFS